MSNEACDIHEGDPVPAAWLLRNLDTGDVICLCPWCLEDVGTAQADKVRELIAAAAQDTGPVPATEPVPDPVSGDESDEDAAADAHGWPVGYVPTDAGMPPRTARRPAPTPTPPPVSAPADS